MVNVNLRILDLDVLRRVCCVTEWITHCVSRGVCFAVYVLAVCVTHVCYTSCVLQCVLNIICVAVCYTSCVLQCMLQCVTHHMCCSVTHHVCCSVCYTSCV